MEKRQEELYIRKKDLSTGEFWELCWRAENGFSDQWTPPFTIGIKTYLSKYEMFEI